MGCSTIPRSIIHHGWMSPLIPKIIAATLIVTAVVHLLPLAGVLGAAKLETLYELPFNEPNLIILMRHRAVLFGLLGVFLVIAAFRPELQGYAFAAGLCSVIAFLWLAWSAGNYNAALARVVVADLVALVALLVGLGLFVLKKVGR